LLSTDELSEVHNSYTKSKVKQQACIGGRYYNTENDILDRKLYIYTEKGLIEDPYKANNKITSDYYRTLIDQCVSYLLGKKPKMAINDETFHKKLIQISKLAQAKGVEWIHFYIKDGEFKLEMMETEQMFPIWQDEKLVEMYRFYMLDNKQIIERYTDNEIETYVDNQYKGTRGHMQLTVTKGAIEEKGNISWGRVPFICLKNNENCTYELKQTKTLIDNYDKIISDFANNLEDSQDVYWILKGFNGNLSAFTEQVKMYKSIPVGDTGDVKAETIEIPHEARMVALDKLENLIFKFGRGVNIEQLAGGSLTNVHIKSMFSNLDMKANEFGTQVKQFILDYIDFYNIYSSYFNKPLLTDREIEFEKSIIINENENLETNKEQFGAISEETRLSNHPWVDDVEQEMERILSTRKIIVEDTEEKPPEQKQDE